MLNLVHKELLKPKKKLYCLKIKQKCLTDELLAGKQDYFYCICAPHLKHSFEFGLVAEHRPCASCGRASPAALTQTPGCWTRANSLPCRLALRRVCVWVVVVGGVVTGWQRLVPGQAMSSEAHSGHLQRIVGYLSEVKRKREKKKSKRPASAPLCRSDLWYPLSYNSAHLEEGRAIYPRDPASYRHLWIRGD